MSVVRISSGGQISVPADVRRRWGVRRLVVHDHGDHLTLVPLVDDPVAAAEGALEGAAADLEAARRDYRQEDEAATERRTAARSS